MGNVLLSYVQATIIAVDKAKGYSTGLLVFMTTTGFFVFCAAYLCKNVSARAAGSGLPELKCLLASELKYEESERLVSKRTLVAKIFGLILACGSCLSVGSEGPLVHTATCIAYFLMKHVYEFQEILQSPSMLRQVSSAHSNDEFAPTNRTTTHRYMQLQLRLAFHLHLIHQSEDCCFQLKSLLLFIWFPTIGKVLLRPSLDV
jgi:Voltage gated chloride channel